MQSGRPLQRAPGSFSPLPGNVNVSSAAAAAAVASGSPPPQPYSQSQYPARPQIRRIDTSSSDDTTLSISKTRSPQSPVGITSPSYASFTTQPNSSTNSLQNFSRPGRSGNEASSIRTASPLTLPPTRGPGGGGYHSRKHSQTQGQFDSTLPSTSTSSLSQVSMPQEPRSPSGTLSASQIAAQAAMQHQQHNRHRSQTVPFPGSEGLENPKRPGTRPVQSHGQDQTRGPLVSPPMLSLTEASVPREGPFGGRRDSSNSVQGYHNGLLGSQAATTAANVVFPRTSPQTSPGLPTQEQLQLQLQHSPFLPPLSIPDKPARSEKSKVKLFSRPKKIDTKGESKERPLPSPGKIGSALASLQRGNFSTASLVDSQSMYNLANSSSATIRPIETPIEREGKEKEKKHHFLSRQKHKLSSKDDYHLPLSSAASNSRPVDPNAPSSLYNFNIPPSPGPTSASFSKSVSGLDLRHGGRALREKRKEDKLGMAHDNESVFTLNSNLNNTSEWPGPPSLGMASSLSQTQSNLTFFDPVDGSKYGLHNMTLDDAWPYLKAKLLVIFEGEDLRLPIEDFNRVVTMHIQYCIQRRSAHIVIEDLRELLSTGFSSLDHTLRTTSEDRLIPALVDVWMVTFTSILPYMQAVFLPLDLEFSGTGPLLTPEQARDFWGGVVSGSPAPGMYNNGYTFYGSHNGSERELGAVLDVRRLVLLAFRDALILPRYEKLKTIFSRLSLEHLPSSLASLALSSPPIISGDYASVTMSSPPRDTDMTTNSGARPGTAMSLDPSIASYNSNSSTLLGDSGSNPSRSRAISNVSFGSGASDPNTTASLLRPFAPTTRARADSDREQRDQNAESGSKQVTDMVGRMLQCMSVLASVSSNAVDPSILPNSSSASNSNLDSAATQDEGAKMVSELGRLLKLNWLGRGRTGRNRRGMVGGRVRREHSDRSEGNAGAGNGSAHSRSHSRGLSGSGSGLGLSNLGGIGTLMEGVGVSG